MSAFPTIEDVARLCGVSTATVSRVLNSPERVRADTRERVRSAIAELGYTPHFGGRALASNRTNTFGAIIPTMDNAMFAKGLQAMQEVFAEAGATLLVATSGYDQDEEAEQIQALIGRGVDGLVLIGEARSNSVYQLLERRGIPFVLVWVWRADSPHVCVGFDNRAAARALADRILDLGHRDVAMIAGVTRGNDRAAERVAGVRDALKARGIELRPESLIETKYSFNHGRDAARRLMSGSPRPTVIICGNDVLAVGAVQAVQSAGLRVPEDVSVTGFDDIEFSEILTPPLATVHVPHRRMGRAAAQLLLQTRQPDAPIASIAFEAAVISRASLGPPPRAAKS